MMNGSRAGIAVTGVFLFVATGTGADLFENIAPGDLVPAALVADGVPGGNAVLEPGETVVVEPSWRNATPVPVTATGTASAFGGPGAPGLYTVVDGAASYGTVAAGQVASCQSAGDCYRFAVGAPSTRPAQHWDATFGEATSTGSLKTWTLHVGDTFTDVPRASPFYRFVETLVHHGVTGGCGTSSYCPSAAITREQLAVFALAAKDGRFFVPTACTLGTEMFADVPATSPFCRWVEELARRGVVTGCGGGQYCPGASVSREQMAVFMLSTKEGPGYAPPACVPGSQPFFDVPASSPFCKWIEELARRGVVTGCGGGNYCPTATVPREQMAVFISATFGITVYGVAPYMYVVNSADDVNDGACSPSHCSFREALAIANATPNPGVREEIRFAIAGSGPHVIRPASALPAITEAVVVDGYSQAGATANALAAGSNAVLKIELDLSTGGPIRLSTSSALLRGLALNRSPAAAVSVEGSGNAIEGCFIGTDAGGTLDLGNATGIIINLGGNANRIGATLPGQRNLISGNARGIGIESSSNNLVQGNLIGTDRAGLVAIPNSSGAIYITSITHLAGADSNVIGGLEQGAGNVVSGNGAAGILASGYVGASLRIVSNTRIQANLIGIGADGSYLPNPVGIELNGSGVWGALIGGTSVAPAGNSISAVAAGVDMTIGINGGPKNVSIRGNRIRWSQYAVRGVPSAPGDITANVIGPNAAGVLLEAGTMAIRGNSIVGSGGGLGIDLAPNGVTPNDPGDGDVGPNGLQNFPVLTAAVRSGNALTIGGSLNSAASATYTVEIFVSTAANGSGYGEGETSLGTISVTTDAAGNAPIAVVLPVTVPAGRVITATATDAAGNTSEFSAARTVQ